MFLQRRTYYYVMSLILPCTLIACTIFLEFILPAESGERVGLGITILLSMAVFQELTSEKLPSSSEHFPLLGKCHFGVCFNPRSRIDKIDKSLRSKRSLGVGSGGGQGTGSLFLPTPLPAPRESLLRRLLSILSILDYFVLKLQVVVGISLEAIKSLKVVCTAGDAFRKVSTN